MFFTTNKGKTKVNPWRKNVYYKHTKSNSFVEKYGKFFEKTILYWKNANCSVRKIVHDLQLFHFLESDQWQKSVSKPYVFHNNAYEPHLRGVDHRKSMIWNICCHTMYMYLCWKIVSMQSKHFKKLEIRFSAGREIQKTKTDPTRRSALISHWSFGQCKTILL